MLRNLLLRQARQITSQTYGSTAFRIENASFHTKAARPTGDVYRSPVQYLQIRPKNKIADSVTDMIPRPKFVPRPVVRGLVGLFGAGFVWRSAKRLMGRSLLFSAITGGGYFLYRLKYPASSEQPVPSEDEDNSLIASARRLIDEVK